MKRHSAKNLVIVLALASAGLFAAWLHLRSRLAGAGSLSDGERRFASETADPIRYAVWDEPRELPASVDTSSRESHPALSPDGHSLVFVVGERGHDCELWIADLAGEQVLDPRPITALASVSDEISPAFSARALWFASDRPGGSGKLDLWRAEWRDGGFEAPVHVASPVNGPGDDCDPAPSDDETLLVFASDREGGAGGFDLYEALDPLSSASAVAPIAALDTRAEEREPALANDGRTLFFASDRSGGAGGFDLWESRSHSGAWLDPRPLANVDGPADERAPAPSADGFTLYFERPGAGAEHELWRARSLELYRLPGLPIGWIEWLTLASLLLLALLAALAKRWPSIETLYKCFLVSVIVHLLLLWWFREMYLERGAGAGTRPDRHRVRLLHETLASQRERGGKLEVARSELAPGASALERAELEASALSASEARPSVAEAAIEAPQAELSAPVPGASEVAPAERATAPEVAVAKPAESTLLRSGSAPALALDAGDTATERASPSQATPERASGIGDPSAARERAAPSFSAALQPAARGEDTATPARAPVASDALAGRQTAAASSPVTVAEPREEIATQGGHARELVLEPAALGGGRSEEPRGPERVAGAAANASRSEADRSPSAPSAAGGGTIVAAPQAPAPSAAVGPSAASEVGPERLAPRSPAVTLADSEPRAAPLGGTSSKAPSAASGSAKEESWISSLLPATAAPARAEDGGPREVERWRQSGASETHEDAPRPQEVVPLAAAAPREIEPPKLERQTWEHTPYQNRAGEEKARAIELHGGTAETEAAVAKGLAYLARIQKPRGHWGRAEARDGKYGLISIGKTGLCLLAFLGAGHTPASGTEHSAVAARAVKFLLASQDPESGHFGDCEAYGHGIATYALAECFALTSDPALRPALEAAVAHILANQNDKSDPRLFGGWSYYYPDGHVYDRWPRTSITAWQVMALESARLSGLAVPEAAFEGARAFLRGACDEERGFVRYNHDPERLGSGYPTLPASTPAGLFALSLLGEDVAAGEYSKLMRFIEKREPNGYRFAGEDAFVERAAGNLYFWYYGTLATFRAGGGAWQSWNEAMKKTLLPAQQTNGSWKPIDVYSRYAKDDDDDRSYSTAMCVLSLEIYYRYFLPLLQVR